MNDMIRMGYGDTMVLPKARKWVSLLLDECAGWWEGCFFSL